MRVAGRFSRAIITADALNDVPLKAFVDTGAQMTVMSLECAQKCKLQALIDQRFRGVAAGVGVARIAGRVNKATLRFRRPAAVDLPPDQDGCVAIVRVRLRDGDLVVEFGYAAPATITYERQGASSTASTGGCPDALWTLAKADNFGATGGPEQIVVVGGTQGLNVGSDVCIETNADGKNVDVQVYDLAMSLDAIKQGIRDELGAGDLCLWRKDGTLMTGGTLESNARSRLGLVAR